MIARPRDDESTGGPAEVDDVEHEVLGNIVPVEALERYDP